jgi:hypothetical protein
VADFYLAQGDLPLWSETLTDGAGNPVLIQGATLVMSMVPLRGGADVITAGGVVTNDDDGTTPNRGKVHRQMLTTETAAAGDYLVRVVATQSSKPITFPNTGYFLWTVTPTAINQQNRYLGVEEFKATAQLQGITTENSDIVLAIEIASRGLEDAYQGRWTLTGAGQVRYYTANTLRTVRLGDVIAITSVDVDFVGFFDYDSDWALGSPGGQYSTNIPTSDYVLDPDERLVHGLKASGGDGEPFRLLRLKRGSQMLYLPAGRDAIRITGQFGWETVPSGLKWAVTLVATRLLRRTRDAPFGIISFGQDTAIARVRDIVNDPEVVMAMNPLTLEDRLIV